MIWHNLTAASYSDTEWMFCYLLTGAPALCWERGMLLGWNSITHYVLWAEYCGGGREEFTLLGSKEGLAKTLCFVEWSGTRLGCVHWPKGNGSNTIRPDFYCHQPLNSIAKKVFYIVQHLRIVLLQYYSKEKSCNLFPCLTWNSFAAIFECGFDVWVGCVSELVSHLAACQSNLDSVPDSFVLNVAMFSAI